MKIAQSITILLMATFFSGCAAVKSTEPSFGEYFPLALGYDLNRDTPKIRILKIQKNGDKEIFFNPASNNGLLWLRPGGYEASLKCDAQPGDTSYKGRFYKEPPSTPLAADSSFSFVMDSNHEDYVLDCWISNSGQIYVVYAEGIVVD